MLSWWVWLPVAFRALRANLLRSILTMLGIIIGVAAVITMVAIGSGAQALVAERIRSLGANLLLIQPGSQRSGGARLGAGTRHTLTEDDAAAILREVPVVTVAAPAVQGPVQVVRGNRNWSTIVVGAVPDHLVAREWPVRAGRPFTLEELAAGAKVVLLGATVAEQLYGPDEDAVGTEVRLGTVPLTVIGVLERKGQSPGGRDQDDLAIAPLLTAKLRLVGGAHKVSRDAVGFIYVKVVAPEAMAVAQEQVEALLRQRHRIGPGKDDDFMIQDLAALVEAQEGATRTFTWLLAAVASVSLLVGGISIMNIMLVSVTERTREIGLRLAVGARQRDIRNQFLIEAVLLCTAGGVMGVAVGIAATYLVAALTGWAALVASWVVLLAVVSAAAVGVFFGFSPAVKASRLDPIEALRAE